MLSQWGFGGGRLHGDRAGPQANQHRPLKERAPFQRARGPQGHQTQGPHSADAGPGEREQISSGWLPGTNQTQK